MTTFPMKTLFALVALWFSASVHAQGQTVLTIPAGKPVMIDGKLSMAEWDDALRVRLSDSVTFYFKHTEEYVLVAVGMTDSLTGFLDLYCTTKKGVCDLHASAKLGERTLTKDKWSDWDWWNNAGWVANTSRIVSFEQRTFLDEPVREFQLSRSLFQPDQTTMMFEVSFMNKQNGTFTTVAYPGGATAADQSNWLLVRWTRN